MSDEAGARGGEAAGRDGRPFDAGAPLGERVLQRLLAMAAEEPLSAAAVPSRFRLVREIGRGGMGIVYEAFDQQLGRRCAIKTIGPHADDALRRRFVHEAMAVARLAHPHIAAVHDATPDWLCMQLVDGGPLAPLADARDDVGRRAIVAIVRDAARALHHAHERGLVHRDVKPSNLLVERGHVFVVDFGLAVAIDADARLSRSGAVVGTPAFMAPEQALGRSAAVDARTDVHGLGATLFFALTGEPPFAAPSLGELLRAVVEQDAPPLPGDRDLAVVVATCLAKEPERRYPSASALADDLDRWLAHEPITARPPTFVHRWRKRLQRHRLLVRGIALAVAATAALVLLVLLPIAWRESAARAAADEAAALADHGASVLQDAAMFTRLGDHPSAWQLLDGALVRTAAFLAQHEVPRVHHLQSRLLRARGRADEALAELERTLAMAPDLAEARCERGLLRASRPDLDAAATAAAIADLQAGLAGDPAVGSLLASVDRMFATAELVRLRGEHAEADDLLHEVLEYEPTHIAARRSLARLALAQGQGDLARYYSASAVDLQQGYGPVYLARERQVLPIAMRGLDGFLIDFASELRDGPDNALALAHRGLVQLRRALRLAREGKLIEALAAAQGAVDDHTSTLQVHDELVGARNNRAVCLLVVAALATQVGDGDRAVRARADAAEDLVAAVVRSPELPELHGNRGLLMLQRAETLWALGQVVAARVEAMRASAALAEAMRSAPVGWRHAAGLEALQERAARGTLR